MCLRNFLRPERGDCDPCDLSNGYKTDRDRIDIDIGICRQNQNLDIDIVIIKIFQYLTIY